MRITTVERPLWRGCALRHHTDRFWAAVEFHTGAFYFPLTQKEDETKQKENHFIGAYSNCNLLYTREGEHHQPV